MARCKINRYHLAKALHGRVIVRLIRATASPNGGNRPCALQTARNHSHASWTAKRNVAQHSGHRRKRKSAAPLWSWLQNGSNNTLTMKTFFFFSPSLFSFNTVPAADFGPSLSPSILTELRGKARELGSAGDVRRSILCFFLSPPHAWELCRRMEATDKTEAEVWSWWELKSYITKEIQKCASDGREKFHSFRTRIPILLFDLGWYWTENIFPISQSKQIE